jgi:hypothetical protein
MKKLLTFLSSIAMVSVTAGSVAACGGNNYDKKDSNGDSILIDGLGNLNFTNGKTDIVSSRDYWFRRIGIKIQRVPNVKQRRW